MLLEQDVDTGQIFAIFITLQLSLKVFQPNIQSGAALCKELCPVSIKQALSFCAGGALQLLPLTLQVFKGLLDNRFQLWFLCHQHLTLLFETGNKDKFLFILIQLFWQHQCRQMAPVVYKIKMIKCYLAFLISITINKPINYNKHINRTTVLIPQKHQ